MEIKSICDFKTLPGVNSVEMHYASIMYDPRTGEYIHDTRGCTGAPSRINYNKYTKVFSLRITFSPELDDKVYDNYKKFITDYYKQLEENQRLRIDIMERRTRGDMKRTYTRRYNKLVKDHQTFEDNIMTTLNSLPIHYYKSDLEIYFPENLQIEKVVTDEWYEPGPWQREITLFCHQTSSLYNTWKKSGYEIIDYYPNIDTYQEPWPSAPAPVTVSAFSPASSTTPETPETPEVPDVQTPPPPPPPPMSSGWSWTFGLF